MTTHHIPRDPDRQINVLVLVLGQANRKLVMLSDKTTATMPGANLGINLPSRLEGSES